MNKELILEKLERAMVGEEFALPLYVSHIEETIFWSGLPKEKQKQIIDSLKILNEESGMHAKAFDKIMETYKKL